MAVENEARVAWESEAMFWALRWGKSAEVIAPISLRNAVERELEAALDAHRAPRSGGKIGSFKLEWL